MTLLLPKFLRLKLKYEKVETMPRFPFWMTEMFWDRTTTATKKDQCGQAVSKQRAKDKGGIGKSKARWHKCCQAPSTIQQRAFGHV